MLRAVHSNRVESLLSALLEVLPPADPFAPWTIVVGSHVNARWLTREIALSRPDWMPALVVGQVPGELAGDPTARWQAALLGAALARLDRGAAGAGMLRAPTPMLPWLRRRAGLATPVRATPVAVFGLSFL